MSGALPTFLIIGAPKSGTSTLYATLRGHPEVFLHPRKELHFFDERWDEGVDAYSDLFADRGAALAWGEATPDYLSLAAMCAPRIAAAVPDARLIAILRDPVDRAYSHYWHQVRRDRENLSFEEAIDSELAGARPVEGRRDFRYVDGSRYATQLDHFAEHFPIDQILVLVMESFTSDPGESLARVTKHIGVRDDIPLRVPEEPVNPYRSPRSAWLRRKLETRDGKVVKLLERLNMQTTGYPAMQASTRARLVEMLATERAALSSRYGVNAPNWDR